MPINILLPAMTAAGNLPFVTRLALRRLLTPIFLAVIVAALAAYARRYYIEPETIAFACEANPSQGWCTARSLLIQTFAQGGLGWASLAAAALATGALAAAAPAVPPAFASASLLAVLAAYAAWLLGVAGLILYCYEFAAVGALTGALVLLRTLSQR
jgi:hypothetical protein